MKYIIYSVIICCILIIGFSTSYSLEVEKFNLQCVINIEDNNFEITQPINAQVVIKNVGENEVFLHISKNLFYNFDFQVRNIKNRAIPIKGNFAFEKELNQNQSDYKTVRLGPKEIYGETVDLSKVFDFNKTDTYIVQAIFYPVPKNLFKDSNGILSQQVQIHINPYKEVGETIAKAEIQKEIELAKPLNADENYRIYVDMQTEKKTGTVF